MATFPQFTNPAQSGAPDLLNEALGTLEHQAVYGKDPSTTEALIWGYYGGRWGGFSIADGTVTLTGSSANYLVVEIATGVLTKSTATTNWNDATNYVRVYKITATTVVTAVEDHRAGPGGVHGGAGGGGGGSLSDGDKGDVTVSGSGAAWAIDTDVVTYAKMQNVSATSRILGRKTSGSGDPEECTLSEVFDFVGSAAQGDIFYRGSSAWTRLAAGTSGFYLQTQGAGANPVWATVAGSITGFTSSVDTSSPNNSVNASIVTASGVGTDISFIAEWKGGNGFFSVQKPDGTTTGGNIRGSGSADFQSARTAAANVTSGTKSALIGTTDSQATGFRSSAIGADRAVVTGDDSLVTGVRNTADAAGCFVMGHLGSSRGADKVFVRGFGGNALAENQAMYYPLRGDIAFSATPKTLTINQVAVGPTTIPALDNSTMGGFTAHVWMKQSPNYLYAKVEGLLTRGANAAATAVVASTVTYIGRTAGTATNDWSVAVAADTTNGGLLVQCSDSSAGALIGCAADVEWHYSSM